MLPTPLNSVGARGALCHLLAHDNDAGNAATDNDDDGDTAGCWKSDCQMMSR